MKLKPMQIKIKKNAYVFAGYNSNNEYRNKLKELEGKWIDVETNHLFNNQYNIKGLRIYDSMVEAVRNDARINKGKCNYCGTMLNVGELCNKHKKCINYGAKWFTPENTYFLKYPEGVKMMEDRILSIDALNIKIGSYYLESYPELDYFRLYNSRQTINFKYDGKNFYICNGIGYKKENPSVPLEVLNELKHKLYALNERQVKNGGKSFLN